MSQRERHASGGTAVAIPREAEIPTSGWRAPAEMALATPLPWDTLYFRLPPEQRTELMILARHQGFLLTSQIPELPASAPTHQDVARSATYYLNSPLESLPSFPLLEQADFSSDLDADQREAVARALQTPDWLLIQSLPGIETRTLLGEIVRQALAKESRVLVLGQAPSMDRLLKEFPETAERSRLRCLGRDERADQLPPGSASCTLTRREKSLREVALQRAQANLANAERNDASVTALPAAWRTLLESRQQLLRIREELPHLRARSEGLSEATRELADSRNSSDSKSEFQLQIQERLGKFDQEIQAIQSELEKLNQDSHQIETELASVCSEVDQVKTLCEAKQGGRWWSASFWKAKFDKTLPERSVKVEDHCKELQECLEKTRQHHQELSTQSQELQTQREDSLRQSINEEVDRQRSRLSAEMEQLQQQQRSCESQQSQAEKAIRKSSTNLPEGIDPSLFQNAQREAEERLKQAEQELHFARRWHDFLQAEGETLIRQSRTGIQLVAGTHSCVQSDAFFNDGSVRNHPFDLLIVEDAHLISETEFNQAIRKANRWILIGHSGGSENPATERYNRSSSASRFSTNRKMRQDLLDRLWRTAHRPLWVREGKRLTAKLIPVAQADRRYLESESVADNVNVELRILTPPEGEPKLAEVTFADCMTPGQCHQFLFQEVGEIFLEHHRQSVRWEEKESSLLAHLESIPVTETVSLSHGIDQFLNGITTIGFSFDRNHWDRSRAEAWLQEQLQQRNSGRTVLLDSPPKMNPGVVRWLDDLLVIGFSAQGSLPTQSVVRLVKVPGKASAREATNGHATDRRGALPRPAGAGFEIDLGDSRRRGELPADWSSALPHQGLVNRKEAERVVEVLETVVRENPSSSIGVTALYPAQVCLLRYLIAKLPFASRVQFIDPHRINDAEYDILLISLTRSHVSRAVTFGEDPGLLQQLLIRAREQLYLFTDPGTIIRRAQWEGACDQYDEWAGNRERNWVIMLLRYLNGTGPHPALFQVLEGEKA